MFRFPIQWVTYVKHHITYLVVRTGFEPVNKRGHLPLMGLIPLPSVLPYHVASTVAPPDFILAKIRKLFQIKYY